jgi:hypothetical protein
MCNEDQRRNTSLSGRNDLKRTAVRAGWLSHPAGLAIVLALSVAQTGHGRAAEEWFVDKSNLSCLVEHAQSYLAETGNRLIVFISLCPVVKPRGQLGDLAQNSSMVVIQEADAKQVRKVLVLDRSQLECISNNPAVARPVDWSDTVVRLDFSVCPK